MLSIIIYICCLVWFWKSNMEFDPNDFYETTSKRTKKYSLFYNFQFFWISLGFYFKWIFIWTRL